MPPEQRGQLVAGLQEHCGVLTLPLGELPKDMWGSQRLATLMPVETEAQRMAVYAAVELEDRKFKDHLGISQDVVNWVQYDYYAPNRETGEIEHKIRTVFVLADGTTIGTGSNHAAASLGRLLPLLKPAPPWNPPKRLKVVSRKGTNGDYYVIDPRP